MTHHPTIAARAPGHAALPPRTLRSGAAAATTLTPGPAQGPKRHDFTLAKLTSNRVQGNFLDRSVIFFSILKGKVDYLHQQNPILIRLKD